MERLMLLAVAVLVIAMFAKWGYEDLLDGKYMKGALFFLIAGVLIVRGIASLRGASNRPPGNSEAGGAGGAGGRLE